MCSDTDRRFLTVVWHSGHAIRWVCALVACVFAGGLLCVVPSEGQAVRDEGFPTKGVFPEEYPDVSGAEEACGPLEVPGAFGEGCVEDSGPDAVGGVSQGAGFSSDPSNPVFQTAPRLECPAAVFVEEMETGVIDCHAWDEAGEEHLDYYWEPVEGAPRGYLDAPRLTGEDRPNPSIVAPSSPFYATLESFASEDATLRYRYRLTATSRVTGLSSWEEVDVFVLLRRPSVYCPLEYEASAGSEIVLSCEGADPLSFRMDYEAGSSVSWEWEGLWGSSASLLSASDTPSPLFRAPSGGAGETHHYIASMTTTSSGVPRTARRRVSVRVVEGEERDMESLSAPTITCQDSPYGTESNRVYEGSADITLDCDATDAPAGATYEWTGTDVSERLTNANSLDATFLVPPDIPGGSSDQYRQEYRYAVRMYDGSIEVAAASVSVTVSERPDIDYCLNSSASEFNEGAPSGPITRTVCEPPSGAPGGAEYQYEWKIKGPTTPSDALSLLSSVTERIPEFTPPPDVPKNILYHYAMTISANNADSFEFDMQVIVRDTDKGLFSLACARPKYTVRAGADNIRLECDAATAPADTTWEWTARAPTSNVDRLSNSDIRDPVFYVPSFSEVINTRLFYYTVSVSAGSTTEEQDVVIQVFPLNTLFIICNRDNVTFYEGDDPDVIGNCTFLGPNGPEDPATQRYMWTVIRTTDTERFPNQDFLSATLSAPNIHNPLFRVPENVDKDEEYVYNMFVGYRGSSFNKTVTVRVLNRDVFDATLALSCDSPVEAYAGDGEITLSCAPTGIPDDRPYFFAWSGNPLAKARLIEGEDGPNPTFKVPDEITDQEETFEYEVTVTAENAIPAKDNMTVRVLKRPDILVECPGNPYSVYEGAEEIVLNCQPSGAPEGSSYAFSWAPRGATADTDLLSATDIASPTFYVPDEVDANETYEYRLTVSAEDAGAAMADVTVNVLDRPALSLACPGNPYSVYEGAEDIVLNCQPSGAPEDSYTFAWGPRGATADTDLLSATDIASPTFYVPDEVDASETYEYRLTVSAEDADAAMADVTVTVLNRPDLALTCPGNPYSAYEGEEDIALNCNPSGAPDGSGYAFVWAPRGATADTDLLSATHIASPTFYVPDSVPMTTRYEYAVTVTADNANPDTEEVTVTVMNLDALALTCPDDPYFVYEGEEDIVLSCDPSGVPEGSSYAYAWAPRGATADTDLLSATNIASPTFYVPDEVDANETYEYRLTVSAEGADAAMADVTVNVLNTPAIALTCPGDPYSVYEGAEDIVLNCAASGAPEGSSYAFSWEPRGATANTDLLSATDIASPTFYVPDEVDANETYEYRLTVSAEDADAAMADVTVNVLKLPSPTALGVTVSASPLRFGVQSADTQVSLDPSTDQATTSLSGQRHAGRMMLAPEGSGLFDEQGEMVLSIELVAPVSLRHESGAASLALVPRWSYAASCEQLPSESIGGLHTQATLSESDCRLLRFGGDLDLAGAAPGRYAGNLNVILRSDAGEETHAIEIEVDVVPALRTITIGPGGVRFDVSREIPAGLTEEQNLSVYPNFAFLTADAPSGVFELSNPSLVPLEVSVSSRFGYAEATEDGSETVIKDVSVSNLRDLSEVLNIHPTVLTLMPGERGVVRYGIDAKALPAMQNRGYAAFFEVTSSPRQYVRADRLPESVAASRRVGRVSMSIPGAYAPDAGASRLRAELLSLSEGVSLSATFLVETNGVPFAGEVTAYDGEGRELGRSETLVYTRGRVQVPLDRLPEDEVVFLRFAPRGSGRLSAPVSVPWNAPRRSGRDIGAAQDSGTPPNAALAETP